MAYDALNWTNSLIPANSPGLSAAVIVSATEPAGPHDVGQRWRDTSLTPDALFGWDGTQFVALIDSENLERYENTLFSHDGRLGTLEGAPGGTVTGMPTVALPANLPSTGVTVPSVYFVRGRRSDNDGWGGHFRLVSTDGTGTADGGMNFKNGNNLWRRVGVDPAFVNVKWFGAAGNGSTDDTAAIQAALDYCGTYAAASPGGGAECFFTQGTYDITSTLTVKRRTSIGGSGGHSGVSERWPEIKWKGIAGLDMMQFEALTGNRHAMRFYGVYLRDNNTIAVPRGNPKPRHAIVFPDRADLTFHMHDFQVSGMENDGVRFEGGVLNVHMHHFRTDACGGWGVYIKQIAFDIASVSAYTNDNDQFSDTRHDLGGGGIWIDSSATTDNNAYMTFSLNESRMEVNTSMAPDKAVVKVSPNTTYINSTGVGVAHNLTFKNVSVQAGTRTDGQPFRSTGLMVEPAYDRIRATLTGCKMSIQGVPSYKNTKNGTSQFHANTVIAPHTMFRGGNNPQPAASIDAMELDTLVNFHGVITRGGQEATLITTVDPSALAKGTIVGVGEKFETFSGATLTMKKCNLIGTTGTLNGVTGTGTSGSNQFTVAGTDVAILSIGQYISIAGANTGVRIERINAINPASVILTLASNLSASVTNAAVSFRNPTFTTWTLTGGV